MVGYGGPRVDLVGGGVEWMAWLVAVLSGWCATVWLLSRSSGKSKSDIDDFTA